MDSKPKLLYFVTEDWYFCSHRLALAVAAQQAGFEVLVVTRVNKQAELIRSHGLTLIPLQLSRRSRNPFRELAVIGQLRAIYRQHKPDLVHHVALKPVLYGSIAARLAGVKPVVNALAGLGFLFVSERLQARLLRPVVELAFRVLLNNAHSRVIFQNPDDQALMVGRNILTPDKAILIRGSGVDTDIFAPQAEADGIPLVILASRLLWDKGVAEFVAAARLLKAQQVAVRFALIGTGDPDNPASIPDWQLRQWHDEGIIEWWGHHEDMPQVLAQAHIVCLPSYREGLPKVLIEAAACSRPIVATDVPGCREIVHHERNGLLVPAKNADALAAAIHRLVADKNLRLAMGRQGRALVEAEFSIGQVIGQTLQLYQESLA